jgi:hypothetical protein
LKRPSGAVVAAGAVVLVALFAASASRAQELEPRAYSPAPAGANFFLAGYTYQSGDVLFDPSLPFSNVRAFLNATTFGYGRTFGLFGRSASLSVGVPYLWASVDGNIGDTYGAITRSGIGDTRLRFAVNLLGGPALTPREFVAHKPEATLGASVTVSAPTGQYSPGKLINIGTNRWAVKTELGLSYPAGRWTFEAAAGVWLFTDNTAFYPGAVVKSQDPLFVTQAHVGYTIRHGLWLAGDATYYTGGQTYSDGVASDTRQSNSRVGATLSVPVARGHTIKLAAANGVSARIGTRFTTYGIAYQFLWFDRPGK